MAAKLIWPRAAAEAIEVERFGARESTDPFIENLRWRLTP